MKPHTSSKVPPPGFPEQHIIRFFVEGLKRSGVGQCRHPSSLTSRELCDAYDVRGMLFMLLLAFGGLRSCEPCHLYLCDVEWDFLRGTGAIVWLWHPARGTVPWGHGRWRDREAYLSDQFGLLPRNKLRGQQRAGWKNLLLEETVPHQGQRSRVYWVVPEAGRLFWRLHEAYVSHLRPRSAASHPYYFSSTWGDAYGRPWTLEAAADTFAKAIRRIGLTQGSAYGLCMHAFRHRVAHWARLKGVPPIAIQALLHHQSVESQGAYGRLEPDDVVGALQAATGSTGSAHGGERVYCDLFPPADRSSDLDDIGRELARIFLGGTT